MSLRNRLKPLQDQLAGTSEWAEAMDTLILMLAPITPFLSEELWQRRHPGRSVHQQRWPQFRADLAAEDALTLIIQINGKMRDRMEIPADTAPDRLPELALERPKIQEQLAGKEVRKVIPVGKKLVNIVA